MNKPGYHINFKLNGKSFSSEKEILTYTKNKYQEIFWFLTDWFDDLDFIVSSSSGSSGRPKSIKIKKRHMISSALATGQFFELPAKSKALLCLSTNFIAGKMMLVRALMLGWHLDIVEPKLNPLENISKAYDFSAMVPLQLHHSLSNINLIKKLIVGGAPISKKMENKIASVESKIFATFGMTETISHIAVKKLNHLSIDNKSNDDNSYFKLLPNIEILTDTNGCLVIDAPKISDELIVTNDLVKIYANSQFKWLGRFDNIINSGGIKIIPEQIELMLQEIIFKRFFISSIPDDVLGEKVVLIIEADPKDAKMDSYWNRILRLKSLKKYEIPKEIILVKSFIETETKKIQRRKTLDLLLK